MYFLWREINKFWDFLNVLWLTQTCFVQVLVENRCVTDQIHMRTNVKTDLSMNQMLFKIQGCIHWYLTFIKFDKNLGFVVFIYKTVWHLLGCIYF